MMDPSYAMKRSYDPSPRMAAAAPMPGYPPVAAAPTNGYPMPTHAHSPPQGLLPVATPGGQTPLTDDSMMAQKRQSVGPNAPPGRVLLIRNLPRDVNEQEIRLAFSPFSMGQELRMFHNPSAGQAFVQFPNEPAASTALAHVRQGGVVIRGCIIQGCYSTRKSVVTNQERNANCRILLVYVTNLQYPVDIDTLHGIFSAHGFIEKIVLFQKVQGMTQALIQFQNCTNAVQALTQLNGRNMYDGCNTLQVQPSKLTELSVKDNPNKGRDFTKSLPTAQPAHAMPDAAMGGSPTARGGVHSMPLGYSSYAPPANTPPMSQQPSPMGYQGMPPQYMSASGGPPPPPPPTHYTPTSYTGPVPQHQMTTPPPPPNMFDQYKQQQQQPQYATNGRQNYPPKPANGHAMSSPSPSPPGGGIYATHQQSQQPMQPVANGYGMPPPQGGDWRDGNGAKGASPSQHDTRYQMPTGYGHEMMAE
ncbi:unnamed protein product [Vitrella brassicaformis CCMP3155]|uniref:RRM domain-containing protein n=2 Tax=Vitrella brassicaformis TaxID=1169539 RepID=A0A0G4F7Z2_VITBC|nr:unnamed protein product [Vitrella brassicaformis CCMP3155]|eukprot:CEM08802.1 unnamed protein product [Vitrella brassicaformis CCMP3155]